MAIKTKFDLEVEINDKLYKVDMLDKVPEKNRKELKAIAEKSEDVVSKRNSLLEELTEKTQEFEINQNILEAVKKEEAPTKDVNTLEINIEQKALLKNISKLKKEVEDLNGQYEENQKTSEEVLKKRYDLTVSGADKAKLKKEIEFLEVPFGVLFAELATLIADKKKKK